jgi:hypothetical protein
MVQYIIMLLLALGIISATQQYENATQPEKQEMHQKAKSIVDDDINI